MVKRLCVAIILASILFGAVAVYYKTMIQDRMVVEKSTEMTIPVTATVTPIPEESVSPTSSVETITPAVTSTTTQETKKGPYSMEINANKTYEAVLKTSLGTITIQLNAKETPITVNNFVALARKNFYDKTIFHRIIKGFMIQGGDPSGNGTGGPGYTFADEPFSGEYVRGTVAMANAGPNTNGSQFFIMHADVPIPKNYVIFGKVTAGLDVVDKIATSPTKPGGENSTPVTPTSVNSVTIIEK
jgi:cyclophilin family peptidyl-prolyl cis-trans isomerase